MGILDTPVSPSHLNRAGLAADRPAASAGLAGVTYTYTDAGSATYTGRVDRCDGTAWITIVPPIGTYPPVPAATELVMHVSTGSKASDANDGLTMGTPKATVGAAVSAGATVIRLGYGTFGLVVSGASGFTCPTHLHIEGVHPALSVIATEANLSASGSIFKFPGNVNATLTLKNVGMQGPSTVDTTITETDNGTPSGTFTLTDGTLTTAAIAVQASAVAVQTALDSAGIAYTSVTGGPLGTAPVVVHGAAPLAASASVTNASLSANQLTCHGIVISGSPGSFDRILCEDVLWSGYWIHCIHMGAGVADGVAENGTIDINRTVFNITGSGIADFRGGMGVQNMQAVLRVRNSQWLKWGFANSNLYHGIYVSPGVSLDFAGVEFYSNSPSTGFAVQQYNQALDGRQKITVTNLGTPSGTFTITANSQTTAPIACNASAATVKAALDALTGMGTTYVTGGPATNGAALGSSWTYNVGLAFTATVDGSGLIGASVAVASNTMSTPNFVRLDDIYIGSGVFSGIVCMSGKTMRLTRVTNKASSQQIRYYTSFELTESDWSASSVFGAFFAGGEVGVMAKMRNVSKGPGTSNTSSAPMTMGSNSGLVDVDDMTWQVNRGTSPVALAAAASPAPTLLGTDGRTGRNRWADVNVMPGVGAVVPKSGAWLGPKAGAESTSAAMVNGTEYAYPLEVPYGTTLQSIGIEITVAGSAGAVIRLGIRLPDKDGYPGAVLLDAGTVDATVTFSTTPAVKSINKVINAPLVWITATLQGAPVTAPTVRTFTGNIGSIPRQALNSASSGSAALTQTGVTGALAGWSSSVAVNNFAPAALVQVA